MKTKFRAAFVFLCVMLAACGLLKPADSPSHHASMVAPLQQLRGTNIVGAELDYGVKNVTNPVQGVDYQMVSHQDIDYLASKGVTFGRMVFSWEGMQPNGVSTPFPTTGNNAVYAANLVDRVAYATSKGIFIMLEPHGGEDKNFAHYMGNLVGSAAVPNSAFADFWTRMAVLYKDNPMVGFGLSNEPNNMSTVQWFQAAQAAIVGIRSTGATNTIFVPGNGWTNASNWTQTWYDTATPQVSNVAAFSQYIKDPANNVVISVHLYLDANAGGVGTDIVSPTVAVDRVSPLVTWARANHQRIHVSEIGTVNSPAAQTAINNFLTYEDSNKDVMVGWSWWTYGTPTWWGNYQFTLSPTSNYTVDQPQLSWLKPYFVPVTMVPVDAGVDAAPQKSPTFPTNPIAYTPATVFTTATPTTNWVYVPTTYDSTHNTPTSLLVWLHGCGGQDQWEVLDASPGGTQNWITISPGGEEGSCWNVNADSTKVLQALADIKTHFNIDPRRVVIGGYSSGGDLAYRTAFYNASLFSGVIIENSSPFRDTGSTQAASLAAASWKFNVAHLLHTEDTVYPPAGVRTELAALVTAGYPVTKIELPGGHYVTCTTWDTPGSTCSDFRTKLLPFMNAGWLAPGSSPPPPTDAGVVADASSTDSGVVDSGVIVDAGTDSGTDAGALLPFTVTAKVTYNSSTMYCKQFFFKNPNAVARSWKTQTIYLKDGKLSGTNSLWGGIVPSLTATGTIVVTPDHNASIPAGANQQTVGMCVYYGASKYVGTNGGLTY